MNILQHDSHRIREWFKRYITVLHTAFVLEKSKNGFVLCHDLRMLASRNPGYIQFGSAGWFWEQSVNTCQIQIALEREKPKDCFQVTYEEASCWKSFGTCSFTSWKRLPVTISCLPGTDGKTGSYDSVEYLGIRKVMRVPAPESCWSPVQRMASR